MRFQLKISNNFAIFHFIFFVQLDFPMLCLQCEKNKIENIERTKPFSNAPCLRCSELSSLENKECSLSKMDRLHYSYFFQQEESQAFASSGFQ